MRKKLNPKPKQTSSLWFVGVAAFIFTAFFLLNCKMGYINDDYTYSFIFDNWRIPINPVRVSSLRDIFKSMYNHYMIWGGRIPVHVAVQLFLMINKIFFNVCNSLMVVLLGTLIYFHANYEKRRNLFLFTAIYTLIWFFIPAANETMIFLTGSINYLWVSVYILLFLIPYRVSFSNERPFRHTTLLIALMIPAGFLAGWSNEPGGGAALLIAAVFLLFGYKKTQKAPVWGLCGLFSVTAGLMVLVLAPGYRQKADNLYQADSIFRYALEHLYENATNVLKQTFLSTWPLVLVFFIALLSLFYFEKKRSSHTVKKRSAKNRPKTKLSADTKFLLSLYLLSSIACFAIYIISPEFVIRYLFMTATLFIVAIGLLISEVTERLSIKNDKAHKTLAILLGLMLVFIAVDGVYQYLICAHNYQNDTTISKSINAQVEFGEKDVILQGKYAIIKGGRFNIYRLGWNYQIFWGGTDPSFEFNKLIAVAFDCDTYTNESDMHYVEAKDYFFR